MKRIAPAFAALTLVAMLPGMAMAEMAEDWEVYFQEPASPIMEEIVGFNNFLMVIVTVITLFVTALLAWVIVRYRAKANPVPSKTTHNTAVEVLWTIVPVIILVAIAIPSFGLLFAQYDPARIVDDYDPETALNVKVTGQAWNWQYAYPELGVRTYTSRPIRDEEATLAEGRPVYAGSPRLLETNLPMVVPVDTVVRLQVTADPTGVLHAFALPAMGVKLDAVPGRVVESWFLAERTGTFYGQCSELCGRYHYAMPIELRVVTAEQFEEWVALAANGDLNGGKALLDEWESERLEQVAAR